MSNPEYIKNQKAHWTTRKLWWCAGADEHFLLLSPMQDRVKYAGIGGIVLAGGVLAALSAYFAFLTIFGPKVDAMDVNTMTTVGNHIGSIIAGLLWGIVIFNLDRFIVSSTGKGDGTDVITPREWRQAAPRLFVAVVLSFTISAPLEIKILESEINAELQKYQEGFEQELNVETDKLANQKNRVFEMRKSEYEGKLAAYALELKAYDEKILNLTGVRTSEMQDKRAYGEGPVARRLQEDINNMKLEKEKFINDSKPGITALEAKLAKVNNEIGNFENNLKLEYDNNKEVAQSYSGILKRIQISHEIGGWIPWMIFFVFLCIETGPIIFKLMMVKGPYDYAVENFNLRQNIENGIIREEHLYEGNKGALLIEKYRYLEVENIQNEKEAALEAGKDVTTKIVGTWKNAQLKDLDENPARFYKDNKFL